VIVAKDTSKELSFQELKRLTRKLLKKLNILALPESSLSS